MIALLFPFLAKEWKYIAIIGLLAGLYFSIYTHGYNTCTAEVAAAKEKATREAQVIADQEKSKLLADNKKEAEHSQKLQEKLDAEIKSHNQYNDCLLTPGGIKLLNEDGN